MRSTQEFFDFNHLLEHCLELDCLIGDWIGLNDEEGEFFHEDSIKIMEVFLQDFAIGPATFFSRTLGLGKAFGSRPIENSE